MKDQSDERRRALTELSNVIGSAGYEKANELISEGHKIDPLDIASSFVFCAFRTIGEYPNMDQPTAYAELMSYLCMIAENETEEKVFGCILDILDGFIVAKKSSPNEETGNVPSANGRNRRK